MYHTANLMVHVGTMGLTGLLTCWSYWHTRYDRLTGLYWLYWRTIAVHQNHSNDEAGSSCCKMTISVWITHTCRNSNACDRVALNEAFDKAH